MSSAKTIIKTSAKSGVRKHGGRNDAVVPLRAAAEAGPPQALRSQSSLHFASVPPLDAPLIKDNRIFAAVSHLDRRFALPDSKRRLLQQALRLQDTSQIFRHTNSNRRLKFSNRLGKKLNREGKIRNERRKTGVICNFSRS